VKNASNLSKNDPWTAEYCQFVGWGKIDGWDNLLKLKLKKNIGTALYLAWF